MPCLVGRSLTNAALGSSSIRLLSQRSVTARHSASTSDPYLNFIQSLLRDGGGILRAPTQDPQERGRHEAELKSPKPGVVFQSPAPVGRPCVHRNGGAPSKVLWRWSTGLRYRGVLQRPYPAPRVSLPSPSASAPAAGRRASTLQARRSASLLAHMRI